MLNTIIDLDIQNTEELSSLGPEYIHILARKIEIIDAYNASPLALDRMVNLIIKLYIDFNRMKGFDVKSKIPELATIIYNYDHRKLITFFLGDTHI